MTYCAPIYAPTELKIVEPVTARIAEPDPQLIALLARPEPLTAEEWAYLEAIEQDAESMRQR